MTKVRVIGLIHQTATDGYGRWFDRILTCGHLLAGPAVPPDQVSVVAGASWFEPCPRCEAGAPPLVPKIRYGHRSAAEVVADILAPRTGFDTATAETELGQLLALLAERGVVPPGADATPPG